MNDHFVLWLFLRYEFLLSSNEGFLGLFVRRIWNYFQLFFPTDLYYWYFWLLMVFGINLGLKEKGFMDFVFETKLNL